MGIKKLIRGCVEGDIKSQEKLYHLLAPKLFALCLKYSRNREEAEDNLHDAFLTLYKKIDQYRFKGSFEGWAKRIAINTALQKYRNQQEVFAITDYNLPDTAEAATFNEESLTLDFLLNCIQELPDRYRLVFNLYVMDNYSHREIAEMLHISTGTSKSNLSRARRLLKAKIEDEIGDTSPQEHKL